MTGASSGIGAAVADHFARDGWSVFGTSRRPRDSRPGVAMLAMDVRSDDDVERTIDSVTATAGPIDVLVNNAGITHDSLAEETPAGTARVLLDTNLHGAVRVTHAVLPQMRRRRRGRIVNVGSLAAWVGEPGEAFYSASKAALARYSEALRHETWALGIDVILVELGAFTTTIMDHDAAEPVAIADYDHVREPVREAFRRALRSGGDPDAAAERIRRIATADRPRFRYAVGRERAVPYLSVLVPEAVAHRLLRRAFGLPGRTGVTVRGGRRR